MRSIDNQLIKIQTGKLTNRESQHHLANLQGIPGIPEGKKMNITIKRKHHTKSTRIAGHGEDGKSKIAIDQSLGGNSSRQIGDPGTNVKRRRLRFSSSKNKADLARQRKHSRNSSGRRGSSSSSLSSESSIEKPPRRKHERGRSKNQRKKHKSRSKNENGKRKCGCSSQSDSGCSKRKGCGWSSSKRCGGGNSGCGGGNSRCGGRNSGCCGEGSRCDGSGCSGIANGNCGCSYGGFSPLYCCMDSSYLYDYPCFAMNSYYNSYNPYFSDFVGGFNDRYFGMTRLVGKRRRGMTNSESDICRQLRHILTQCQDSQSLNTDGWMDAQKDKVETIIPSLRLTPDENKKKKCSCHDAMETLTNIANKYNIPLPWQA